MGGDEIEFGRFRLNLGQRELLRAGAPVRLGSRAMDLLSVLATAKGEVVSKDELLTRVWPGLTVEENNLQVQISALRKVLDEDNSGQSHLVTVPGRGYRLVGFSDVPPTPALPDKPSIAVLPFQNMSDDPKQDYFADGIVEDIITALCHIRWLFVIARNSSFAYKGRSVDVKQVARELGVRYVLEGGVRKADQRVRITAQLIDAATGAHLWADHFDGSLEHIFELQDQVTASVVGAISPKLEQAEIDRAKHKPTESLDAYDYFLRGLASAHRVTRDATTEALRLFARATELDPDFASPYGVAAFCYVVRKMNGWMSNPAALDVAEAARLAWRAAELGKDDAVALSFGGLALGYVAGDLEGARRAHRPVTGTQSEFGDRLVCQRYGAGISRRRARLGDRALGARDALEPARSLLVYNAGCHRLRAFLRWPLRRGVGMGRKGILAASEHPRHVAYISRQQCFRGTA